ncbi:hydrogenase maturation protease [Saccharopolyspora rosea]|uniref:Hydrogenase maturation protease n=1 Tax=Saccharopolyspora rosea TaxID=524884 RepID=A0ABW3FYN3_9PSEU|nr:hydrogenase maturation protease [Saccharopolyspora rosea]
MGPRVLVAGIGNVFFGDDGFGVEVARRLAEQDLPEWVRIADYGISGMHLAFDMLGGYGTTILVDIAPRGHEPGTLSVLELRDGDRTPDGPVSFDAHGMGPQAVLAMLDLLGGGAGRILVVGCEPADTGHRMGLSEPVRQAVEPAVRTITELVRTEAAGTAQQAIRGT